MGENDNFSSNKREKAEYIFADIRDIFGSSIHDQAIRRTLSKAHANFLRNVDTVFHCAALARVQPSIQNPQKYHKANIDGTFNVLLSARDSKVRRLVYSASSSAYGDQKQMPLTEDMPTAPISPYALHKLIGEQYCFVFLQELPINHPSGLFIM